ncbi:MAG TPA: stage II sporulation protein D [Oscillospiraceae bacterium]|nr:stage II sporulation protein D [Oscillospiraceae bacterium]
MKRLVTTALLLLVLLMIGLPTLLIRACASPTEAPPEEAVDRTPLSSPAEAIKLKVFQHHTSELAEMTLEEYLVGVLAAEMPASFELEALKTQAVVARTYTVNQMLAYGGKGCAKHAGADICSASSHCQAWQSEEQALAKWPKNEAAGYYNKLRTAVRETAGQVITHDGKLIDAVFHSTCGGQTENSEDVWSTALPYLRSVSCTYCRGSRWYKTEHAVSAAKFAEAIVPYVSALPVAANGRPLLGTANRSATGRIKSLVIAGEPVTGRDFRTALGLPSTNVQWEVIEDKVLFTAQGYGHGVGLCQYGADGLAKAGQSCTEIINHYYKDVNITTIPVP